MFIGSEILCTSVLKVKLTCSTIGIKVEQFVKELANLWPTNKLSVRPLFYEDCVSSKEFSVSVNLS